MNLADVNVLLHALRTDSPDHARCRTWLEAELNPGHPFGVSPLALSAVIRVSTHPKIYRPPTPLVAAAEFCEVLLEAPGCVRVETGPRHWIIFNRLLQDHQCVGNDVTDAWFAALAIESGCTWVTLDRGFARFKGLSVRAP